MKKILRNSAIVLILTLPCAELAARIVGWRPYINQDFHVNAEPDQWIIGDSLYGIRLNPGEYAISLEKAIHFTACHTNMGRREVPASGVEQYKMFVFGCSFTYGYGVNDNEVFTNRLQEKYPDFEFTNFAVPGYGTVQSLMQLESELEKGNIPEVAILVYSKEHLERNALANSYRRALKIGFARSSNVVDQTMWNARFPFKEINDDQLHFVKWSEVYTNWPGRETFAIVNAVQSSLDAKMGEDEMIGITKKLLNSFIALCSANRIKPLLVNLDDPNFAKHYPQVSMKALTANISFDFESPGLTNLPFDSHPNAKGHTFIAEKINRALATLLND